jgi:hypothetical protein
MEVGVGRRIRESPEEPAFDHLAVADRAEAERSFETPVPGSELLTTLRCSTKSRLMVGHRKLGI